MGLINIMSINRSKCLSKMILATLIFSLVSITFCEAISESPIETNETNTTVTIPPSLKTEQTNYQGHCQGYS